MCDDGKVLYSTLAASPWVVIKCERDLIAPTRGDAVWHRVVCIAPFSLSRHTHFGTIFHSTLFVCSSSASRFILKKKNNNKKNERVRQKNKRFRAPKLFFIFIIRVFFSLSIISIINMASIHLGPSSNRQP